MMRMGLGSVVVGLLMLSTPAPAAVLICAGDIAESGGKQLETSDMLLSAIAANSGVRICTAGDNAYPSGTLSNFASYYTPTWGRSAIKSRTFPTPGNHDYKTSGAAAYYSYFGSVAAKSNGGFYTKTLDANWIGVFMNSEAGISAQTTKLRSVLSANRSKNVLLVWHKPRFAIGSKGAVSALAPWWQAADEFNVDLIIVAHEHFYANVLPRLATGAQHALGTREFVVGTGGAHLRSCGNLPAGTKCFSHHGVTRFTLRKDSFEWVFRSTSGTVRDSGSQNVIR